MYEQRHQSLDGISARKTENGQSDIDEGEAFLAKLTMIRLGCNREER